MGFREDIIRRHAGFADRYADCIAEKERFRFLTESQRRDLREAIRLAVFDGALAELEMTGMEKW